MTWANIFGPLGPGGQAHRGVCLLSGWAASPFPGSSCLCVLSSGCCYCCKTRTRRWKSSSRKYNVRRYHPQRLLPLPGRRARWIRCALGLEAWVQILPLSFSICPKAQAKTASELSKSMESMRGHLQAQLRCKEAENSRLCMQIKVPASPSRGGEGSGGRRLAVQGRLSGHPYHTQEGFAPKDYGAAATKALVLQGGSGTVARAVDLGVLGVLPSSDWVDFLAPKPITSSLGPSVLLTTHGEGGWSDANGICEWGLTKVTALLSIREISDYCAGSSREGSRRVLT